MVLVIDGARFLPANTTISRVLGSVWSSNRQQLARSFEGVAQPHSDALIPSYACSTALGTAQNNTRFEDATALVILQASLADAGYSFGDC
jgi:hypothetical protein